MQINASAFTDPALRPRLEQYYENKKAAAVEAWKARQDLPEEVKLNLPDGSVSTAKAIPVSAEQMEKAFVSFDKWLELQQDIYGRDNLTQKRLDTAQKRLERLEKEHPDTSSNVRTTFSSDGVLLAYVNEDSGLVTSNAASGFLQPIAIKANDLNLSGQARVDYLNREIMAALSERYQDFDMASYTDQTMLTKREFAEKWYQDFDTDRHYNDAVKEARASVEEARAWHRQWQANMNEIQNFLLGFQEAA